MMKRLIYVIILALLSSDVSAQSMSFWVVPHGEDWETFMGAASFNEISDGGNKIVIIDVTAGNWFTAYLPGITDPCVSSPDFYTANEAGVMNAVDFAVNQFSSVGADKAHGTETINGHSIRTYTNGQVKVYFLRLDENSIDIFYTGGWTGGSFWAFDGSASYSDYIDVANTIGGIYRHEITANPGYPGEPSVSTFDFDPTYNPGDHDLHYFTGFLAFDGFYYYCDCPFANVHAILYEGFNIATQPINMADDVVYHDAQSKAALYNAFALGMLNDHAQVLWDNFPSWPYDASNDFLYKEYPRYVPDMPTSIYCPTSPRHRPGASHNMGNAAAMPTSNTLYTAGTNYTHPQVATDPSQSISNTPTDNTSISNTTSTADNNIYIYPNPANDNLHIYVNYQPGTPLDVTIVDIVGRTVLKEQIVNSADFLINTSALTNGSYVCTISDNEGMSLKKQIIIFHSNH